MMKFIRLIPLPGIRSGEFVGRREAASVAPENLGAGS